MVVRAERIRFCCPLAVLLHMCEARCVLNLCGVLHVAVARVACPEHHLVDVVSKGGLTTLCPAISKNIHIHAAAQ